jgi:hypothetical protein
VTQVTNFIKSRTCDFQASPVRPAPTLRALALVRATAGRWIIHYNRATSQPYGVSEPEMGTIVTQHSVKPSNYRLLYILAGEEFRGEAWEVDPKELRFGWKAALSLCKGRVAAAFQLSRPSVAARCSSLLRCLREALGHDRTGVGPLSVPLLR